MYVSLTCGALLNWEKIMTTMLAPVLRRFMKEGEIKAALNLMKISPFDKTIQCVDAVNFIYADFISDEIIDRHYLKKGYGV